jgi:hypothetical protein
VVKMFALIPARPDLSLEHFHEHWRTRHRELALGLDTLKRYVQCHRLDLPLGAPPEDPIEGIALVWFEDVDSALGMIDDPTFVNDIAPDEFNFMDVEKRRFLFTEEEEVVIGGAIPMGDDAVKVTLLLRRGEAVEPDDFATWWKAEQPELLERSFPSAVRAVSSLALTDANDPAVGIDAIAELWWPDAESLERDWGRAWATYLAGSGARIDPLASTRFVSEDLWVIAS